jgi:hypothetical protein
VAYWNLSQRTVRKDQSSEETKWFVNCQPLRFFHFSGSVVDDPIIFSRHSNQFTLETLRDVEILFRIYVEETHKCGRSKYKNINYSYSWNGAGKVNLHTPYILTNNIEQQHAKWSVQIGSNLLIRNQDAWIGIGNAVEIGGWDAYQKHRHSIINSYKNRVLFEQSLLPNDDASSFYTSGHCCICGVKANFITSFMYSVEKTPDGRSMPNWREHMQCEHCGLVNRVRAALHALFSVSTPESSSAIYITEHMTSTYTWLKDRFNNLSSSEYFGPSYFPGTIIDGIRHENIMELSFDDLTFDKILSFDVLEHVPEPYKAFSELYRVLKNEGELIFSVPFSTDSKFDIIRAEITKNGIINHILPPEYHGNPVDQEGGSLCFRYFGWDMLDRLRALGFVNVRALCYWSDDQGYLGEEQILFFAQK